MPLKVPFLIATIMMIGITAGPGWTQAPQSMPGSQSAHADATLEGTVKKVNPVKRTVEISMGVFGLWAKTLEMKSNTQIHVEGRQAGLEDLYEGAKVKASYETRVGQSFATSIDVMPAAEPTETPGKPSPPME
jgi:Cu/Ag efflux protein CusF